MLLVLTAAVSATEATPGLLALLGLVAAVVGLVATLRGRVRWAGLSSRCAGALVVAAGLTTALAGCAAAPQPGHTLAAASSPVLTPAPAASDLIEWNGTGPTIWEPCTTDLPRTDEA